MSRTYATRVKHIKTLNDVLSAREDFKSLELHRHYSTGEEYLFLTDIVGHVYMLDVTGYSRASINHTLALIECGFKPRNLITDSAKKLELAKMFR